MYDAPAIRLYKFYPLDSAIKCLLSAKLKISRLRELNDPFEYDPHQLTNEWDRLLWEKSAGAAWKKFGFISFCENWSSPLLWAHYADSHRGLCLGFDVKEDEATSVRYVQERSILPSVERFAAERDEAAMIFALTTKFDEWRYEQERRVFCEINYSLPEEQMQFEPFGEKMALKSVILGLRCPLTVFELRKIVERSIEIVQACKDTRKFQIVSREHWLTSLEEDGPVQR